MEIDGIGRFFLGCAAVAALLSGGDFRLKSPDKTPGWIVVGAVVTVIGLAIVSGTVLAVLAGVGRAPW